MAQVNAGRVRFVSRGEYNNSTQYYLFDLVDYNGSSYFAKANTTGNVPTNTTYWQLVAEKGNTGGDGPVGPTGNGITSIVKTASAGLIDTYTITYTNGTTTTFEVTNGQDGEVTQEYVDEENERLKSVFNVLPKVSGSGESVTLENTGDTMLYKMDLKGNTSQEVIQGEVGLEEEDTSIYVDDVNEDKENYITLKGNTSQETTSVSDGDQYDSPSPDYPQEVEVVTGLNEVKVEGKNLFDITTLKESYKKPNEKVDIAWSSTDYIEVKENTQYIFSHQLGTNNGNITFYNEQKEFIKEVNNNTITRPFTTDVGVKYVSIGIWHSGGVNSENDAWMQLEQGSTATTYEAYQGASYPVNLGSIELCKIGTYQDRIYKSNGNWYLHKEIGKVVLDGTNNAFATKSGQQGNTYTFDTSNFIAGPASTDVPLFLSDKFIPKSWDDRINYLDSTIMFIYSSATNLIFRFGTSSNITTLALANTWLTNNNVTLYGILATPTDTQITDTTLVNQLNALYTATIHSTTHINTETSNLLPYINLKYNVVTASPSPDRASEVKVVKGNNTITISNEDGTKTQTYNLTLGNLELCKIGDYQDYFYKDNGNWYKYAMIGKVVLNGSEEWQNQFGESLFGTNLTNKKINTNSLSYCNRFKFHNIQSGLNANLLNGEYTIQIGTNDTLYCKDTNYTNTTDFKNWLSTHNTNVYYPLATPTQTQITDQLLVSQLDELQKAISYYDKTLITQVNDDNPFILDVVGIRDLQDIFNL